VPNARVKTSHALVGAVFVSLAFGLAQEGLAWYLETVPTYSAVYGAFATVPILLLWLYLVWLIVLLGAVVVAYLPLLLGGVARRGNTPGWAFQLALEVLAELEATRGSAPPGLSVQQLARRLRVDPLQLEQPLRAMQALGWVGQLSDADGRWVVLVDLARTPLAPLAHTLLLPDVPQTRSFWQVASLQDVPVLRVVPGGEGRRLTAGG
jgi:membrane protein